MTSLLCLAPAVAFGAPADAAASRDTGPSGSAVAEVRHAAALTAALGTRAVSVALVPGPIFGVRQATVRGHGAFDFAAAQGRLLLSEVSGDETLLFRSDALYVREPTSRSAGLPAGKTWIVASLIETPGSGSTIPQFIDQAEAVNPLLVLDEVAWGATRARQVSPGDAGGGAAYVVTVDLTVAGLASGPAGTGLARAIKYQIAAGGPRPRTLRVRVTIGSTGRVSGIQCSPPGSGVGHVTFAFAHPAPSPIVGVPPSAAVVDIAALSPGGEQESGLGDVA